MKKFKNLTRLLIIILITFLNTYSQSPTLIAPSNGQTNLPINYIFSWNSVAGATYRLQISTGSGFWWNQIDVANLTTTSYNVTGLYMYTPYYWRVAATVGGSTTYSEVRTFTTGSSTGETGGTGLVLVSPANGATGVQITNTFYWNSVTGATSYRLQISSTSGFTMNVVDQSNITNTDYQVNNLAYNTNYYWRVGAIVSGVTTYSDTWSFTTGLPGGSSGNPGPTLISPVNSATDIYTNPTFTWQAIEGATYRIQVATSDYFGAPQVDVSNLTSPTYTASGLYMVTPYYWRVNATNSEGTTDWSATNSFTTGYNQSSAPAAPVLAYPANGAVEQPKNLSLQWNTSSNASSYGVQVSLNSSFSSFVINQTAVTGTSFNLSNLNTGVTYYWRVNAANSQGTSPWSATRSFTTENLPVITITNPADNLLTADSILYVMGSLNSSSKILLINYDTVKITANFSFADTLTLHEGDNLIRITAKNSSGDSTVVLRNVTLDATPPLLTVNAPADSLITSAASIQITGIVTDVHIISLSINNIDVTPDASGNFTYTANLAEGINIITLEAKDELDNTTTVTRIISRDTVKPIITLSSPVDSIITNLTQIFFTGSVNDSTSTTLKINGVDVVLNANGEFNHPVSLIEGNNLITIECTDAAGNTETVVRHVRLDAINPVITITNPQDSLITKITLLEIAGNVFDSTAVTLKINGNAVTSDAGGNFTYQLALVEGTNIITLQVTDAAGNETILRRFVRLDSLLPQLVINEPIDSLVTNIAPLIISGIVTDSTSVSLKINADSITVNTSGEFIHNFMLTEGKNNIILVAEDKAGNLLRDTLLVTLDSVKPTLAVTSPDSGFVSTVNSLAITGSVLDSSSVLLKINNEEVELSATGTFTKTINLLPGNNEFEITATDKAGNSITKIFTIIFNPVILPPDPATIAPALTDSYSNSFYDSYSFLWQSETPVQYEVQTGSIEPHRAGVVRGVVIKMDGTPLAGVKIKAPTHPEWGYTYTREDGCFDIGLNGGGYLVLEYEKSGYRPAQRIIDISWNKFITVDTVALAQPDQIVTEINFNDPIEVARGSEMIDVDGSRRVTLFFEEGTVTTMKLSDGTLQVLDSLTVRATEYTVGQHGPKAMPATLPKTSSYTYCTELMADEAIQAGAVDVSFSKNFKMFVDNFIDLPVGTKIPTGKWNWKKSEWIPKSDGVILRILNIQNGKAVISANASGTAADSAQLASLGISNMELTKLAEIYSIGDELWRTELNSFGVIDQGFGTIAPTDASEPAINRIESFTFADKYPSISGGEQVDVLNQSLHKEIELTDVPFSLHYSSDKVEGRESQLIIPITGATVPASLSKVSIKITIGGKVTEAEFNNAPNQNYTFVWDGKDVYGRTMPGRHKAFILLGYTHSANYQSPSTGSRNFGLTSGLSIPNVYSRQKVTMWRCTEAVLGKIDNRAAGLGGWNIDINHNFDFVENVLFHGSGERQTSEELGYLVETVAGNGIGLPFGRSGPDNIPATETNLGTPYYTTVGPDGTIYIAEHDGHKVRKVTPDGIITTIAGTGTAGYSGDGGLAINAQLRYPIDVEVDKEGNIYILETQTSAKIRKIDTNGIISTIIGQAGYGFSGDGGTASEAQIYNSKDIEIGPDGSIYIADQNWYNSSPPIPYFTDRRIRKISPDGIITTIAGGVTNTSTPENIPATQVNLENFSSIKFGPDGNLYIAMSLDPPVSYNPLRNSLVMLDADGRIKRITQGGYSTTYDENGKVTNLSNFPYPGNISFLHDCSLCLSSWQFRKVFKVEADLRNYEIAGTGDYGYNGDGLPALKTRLAVDINPTGADTGPDGNLYFINGSNRILKLFNIKPGFTNNEYSVPSTNGKETFYFDSKGHHLRTIDALTGERIYSFTYNTKGKLIGVLDQDSLYTIIERDTLNNITAIISPYGDRDEITLNEAGYLESVTNPGGEHTNLTYGNKGLLTALQNPRGYSSNYQYDGEGRLISVTEPGEGTSTYTKKKTATGYEVIQQSALGEAYIHRLHFDPTRARRRTIIDPHGVEISVNELTSFKDTLFTPDGTVTYSETGFDPRFGVEVPVAAKTITKTPGGLTSTRQEFRHVTEMQGDKVMGMIDTIKVNNRLTITEIINEYDALNTLVKTKSPGGRISEKLYSPEGRLIQEVIPGAGEIKYIYTDNKLTQKIHFPETAGVQERRDYYFYDIKDRLISSTDAVWQSDSMIYDVNGRLMEYMFKDGRRAKFMYDENGNLTTIIPPGRTAHLFEFDAGDKKTGYKPPEVNNDSLNYIKYFYNEDGNLVKTLYPDSSAIEMIYDDRDCGCTSSGRVRDIVFDRGLIAYDYDSVTGQITQVTTSTGDTLSYTYDGSLPKSETWKGSVNGKVSLSYDNDFRVIRQSINDSINVNFTYDYDGLMKSAGSLKMNYNTTTGKLIADTLGNIISTYDYNNFGELRKYTARYDTTLLFQTEYVRDDLGRITQIAETNDGTYNLFNYSYDTAGRLIEVKKNNVISANYIYDSNGNRLAKVVGTDTTKGVYDEQDRLLDYGNSTFSYNKNGYLTSKIAGTDTTKYSYDNLGNLLSVQLSNGTNIEYQVDANNRRVEKRINSNVQKKWLYSGELTPIAELDSVNNVTKRFIYGTKSNIPDYYIQCDTTYKIISDHLGSLRQVINAATGEIKEIIDYNEYGEVLSHSGNVELPFGFAGGLTDEQTGLVRFGARDYDPVSGRWNAKDPILFESSDINLYSYVINDPINMYDPDGQDAFLAFDLIVGAIYSLAYDDPEVAIITASASVGAILAAGIPGSGVSGAKDKVIVIGENMKDRVIPFAEKIGATWYKARGTNPLNYMRNNAAWLRKQMNNGAKILDIGPDDARRLIKGPSQFYEMERTLIKRWNYGNYIRNY